MSHGECFSCKPLRGVVAERPRRRDPVEGVCHVALVVALRWLKGPCDELLLEFLAECILHAPLEHFGAGS